MELKPGMSFNQLKTDESSVGSVQNTDLINQVGGQSHHTVDPRLQATSNALHKLNNLPSPIEAVPQKLESFRQRLASIRESIKGE